MLKQIAIAAVTVGLGVASQAFAGPGNLTGIVDGQAPITIVGGTDTQYTNVNGSDWTSVTSGTPTGVVLPLTTLEIADNGCGGCGDDITGTYRATQSGFIQFAQASDDAGGLFVNGVNVISQQGDWTGSRQYNEEANGDPTNNFSVLIPVTFNQVLTIEAFHAEGGPPQDYAVTVGYTPEPASLGLLGLCGLGLLRRTRKA